MAERSKLPAQILADAAAAIDRLHSFRMSGTVRFSAGPGTVTADVVRPGRLRMTFDQGGKVYEMIVIGSNAYMKGNAAIWRAQASARMAASMAGRWIELPAASLHSLSALLSMASSKTLGRCMLEIHLGTLSSAGTATVAGQSVVVVADKGDVPGSMPGKVYIATSGPPLPLLEVQTGRQAPGGVPDQSCGETRADVAGNSNRSRISLSHFDQPLRITAPPHAVTVQNLLRNVTGSLPTAGRPTTGHPAIPVAVGFAGDTAQAPTTGAFRATARVRQTTGYSGNFEGKTFQRTWTIVQSCARSTCRYFLDRDLAGGPPLVAPLVRQADGWHATFPDRSYVCHVFSVSSAAYWQQHSNMVLRFSAGGRALEAHERNFSYTPACGYGTDTIDWTGTHY